MQALAAPPRRLTRVGDWLCFLWCWFGVLGGVSMSAKAADLKVLTAGAFKPVLLSVQTSFEATSGHRLLIDNDTAGGLQKRVLSGESFDVVISSPTSLAVMRQAQKIVDAPPIHLARVGIGVAVPPGAALPDISTVPLFQQTLAQARKIAYIDPASGGSSGIYLDRLFESWGMRESMRSKAVLVPGGLVSTRLLDGSADLAIHQISEIKAVPNVQLVGPLPPEIQNYTVYAAALSRQTANPAAQELWMFLNSSALRLSLQEKGMEPAGSEPLR